MEKIIELFFSLKGRIPRLAFWMGFAGVMVASIAFQLVPVIGPVLGLALLWPQIAIHVKRLHDMGLPGWLLLVPLGLSLVCIIGASLNGGRDLFLVKPGDVPALFQPGRETASWFFVAAGVVEFVFLMWVGTSSGQKAANKYGPAA